MNALLRKRDERPVEEEETVVDQSETVPVFSRSAAIRFGFPRVVTAAS
jgi:hypothetical protein